MNVASIDYTKIFESQAHDWIIKCQKYVTGISRNIKGFMQRSKAQWKIQMLINSDRLGEVNTKRRIFQGDSLSLLLFVTALIPLSVILSKSAHGY